MGCQQPYIFNVAAFRVSYPSFANTTAFPDATLQAYFDVGELYIANNNYGWMTPAARALALNLMTAHEAAISLLIANGQTPTVTIAAGIDKINVTTMPPPVKSQLSWWLSTTPYGQQLLALLGVYAAGGWGVGGSPTRAGFRGNGIPLGAAY